MTASALLSEQTLATLFESLHAASQWIVGFSGGLDSTVLLHSCHAYLHQLQSSPQTIYHVPPKLSALHIDHQLMPDHRRWTAHCEEFCSAHGIPLQVAAVEVDPDGGGLEQAARTARYEAFAQAMHIPGTVVLLAHHQNDQAETLLLRLFRGSGIRGAAAMQAQRVFAQGTLARPLLDVPRSELESYARHFSLDYIDDPSNSDETLDRNYVRRRVLPAIAERWPVVNKALSRFARLASEQQRLGADLAVIDFAAVVNPNDSYGQALRIDPLTALPGYRRTNLYRYWLDRHNKLMPSAERLGQIDTLAINNRGASAIHFNGHSIRVHDGSLYCVPEQWLQLLQQRFAAPIAWDGRADLKIDGCGILRAEPRMLSATRPVTGSVNGSVTESATQARGLVAGAYWIGSRQEGAIARLHGQGKPLKKILQAAGVPAWLRDVYPIVYRTEAGRDEIAAVGDICVCDGSVAEQGARLFWCYQYPATLPEVVET